MSKVVFVDTSILCEILRVPGKTQQPVVIQAELHQRVGSLQSLVLPTAALIETGNHIAQAAGGTRRRLAVGLTAFIERALADDPPWQLHGATWDERFLQTLCAPAHAGSEPWLVSMAVQGIGLGDVSILAEARAYRQRVSGVEVEIWTLDHGLAAHAP